MQALSRARALPVVLWVYGLALSIFLASVWGRAVAADAALVADAAAVAAGSDLVAGRVESWIAGELAQVPGLGGDHAAAVAAETVGHPDVEGAMAVMVREVVAAAAAPTGRATPVDVASIFMPAVPALLASLDEQGIDTDEATVSAVVASLEPLVVRAGDGPPLVGEGSQAVRSLTLATALALALALLSAGAALWMADDRRQMRRGLLTKVAVSALSFAVMLQVGAWIIDPGGGRAPVRSAVARMVGAKVWLPVLLAGVAGVGAWAARRRGVKSEASDRPMEGYASPSSPNQ